MAFLLWENNYTFRHYSGGDTQKYESHKGDERRKIWKKRMCIIQNQYIQIINTSKKEKIYAK